MRFVVETGTDIATLCAGDVTELTDVMATRGRRPKAAVARAVGEGRLWRMETGADGAYLFHLFVDEEPSEPVKSFLRDPQVIDAFPVPSGQLLVGGEEVHIGALPLAKARRMAEVVQIARGTYRLTAYNVEAPDDYLENRMKAVATPEQEAAWRRGTAAFAACFWGTAVSLFAAYQLYVRWHAGALALAPFMLLVVGWLATRWYRRQPSFVGGERIWQEVQREVPSIVLVLRSTAR